MPPTVGTSYVTGPNHQKGMGNTGIIMHQATNTHQGQNMVNAVNQQQAAMNLNQNNAYQFMAQQQQAMLTNLNFGNQQQQPQGQKMGQDKHHEKNDEDISGQIAPQVQGLPQGVQPGGYQMVKVQHNQANQQMGDQRGHYGQQTSGQVTPNQNMVSGNADPNSSNGNSAENKSDEPYFSPNQNL